MKQAIIFHQSFLRKAKHFFLFFLILLALLTFYGCKKTIDLCDYVSEYRSNVLWYEEEGLTVKAHDVAKEYPYLADGYKGEMTRRAELFITAPTGTESCHVHFNAGGIEHTGEASFDSVKKQFYYSCAADLSQTQTLSVTLRLDDTEKKIDLTSIKTDGLLNLKQLIDSLFEKEDELLKTLVDKNEFVGELYVRLLYEEDCYFYVGVVDRQGKITAFLMDGETGEILAKRNP